MNGNKLKVLFLTPYFVPDYAAGSLLYAALAEDLARKGYQVTVLTGMPYYGREKIWDEYKGRFFADERRRAYRVVRVYTLVAARTNVPGRLLSWFIYNVLATFVGLVIERHDVIFAMNPFTMAGLPLHILSRVKRMKVIYSVEDLYPDALVQAGILKEGWAANLVNSLEMACYRKASFVRVLSEGMRHALVSRGMPAEKIVCVPNFADIDFVRPLPRMNAFREKYGLGENFVVLYAGNIGVVHGVDCLLAAARLLKNEPHILFVIVGEGKEKLVLQRKSEELALSNVRFIPFQPREDLPFVLASADVSAVTLKASFASESIPSKVYWILASGRAMIAAVGHNSDIAKLVEEARCGFRVDPEDPKAIADAILKLRDDPIECARMGERARDFVTSHCSRQSVSRTIASIAESLINRKDPALGTGDARAS